MGRANGDHVSLVRQVDVIHVPALAGQKPLVLDPLDRLSDAEFGHSVPRVDWKYLKSR